MNTVEKANTCDNKWRCDGLGAFEIFRAHGFQTSILRSIESHTPWAVPAGNRQRVDVKAILLRL